MIKRTDPVMGVLRYNSKEKAKEMVEVFHLSVLRALVRRDFQNEIIDHNIDEVNKEIGIDAHGGKRLREHIILHEDA